MLKMPDIKLPKMPKLSDEQKESIKATAAKTRDVAFATAKYGSIFCSGVLVGTICGVVLFFKISDGDI